MHRILHLLREVGDIDGFKRAFAHAYSAAHTEVLGDQRLAVHKDYGLVSGAHGRAEVLALSGALAGLASIAVDDGNPHDITSIEKKGPAYQPEVYYHELHIKPVLETELLCIYLKEGIAQLLNEEGSCDYHDHYRMPWQRIS